MKVKEIAEKINEYLKKFESDEKINTTTKKNRWLWCSMCIPRGRFIFIKYISYQGGINLNKNDAEKYLEWLNSGNIGRHWEALK